MTVYRLPKHDLRVTFTQKDHRGPFVELAVGSEVRTLPLGEFTNFWLDMIEMGRIVLTAELDFVLKPPRPKNGR